MADPDHETGARRTRSAPPGRARARVRFFALVWRFNALLIAAVGVAGLLGMATLGAALAYEALGPLATQQVMAVEEARDATPEDATPPKEQIGALSPIGATGLLSSPVWIDAEIAYASVRGPKSSRNVIDWLIYDPATGGSRHLIGARPTLLVDADLLRWRAAEGAPLEDRALFLRYVQADSTGDGLLTGRDQEIFALARPDGRGLTPLDLTGRFVGLQQISRDEAVLAIEDEAGFHAVHLDLARRAVTRRAALTGGRDGG